MTSYSLLSIRSMGRLLLCLLVAGSLAAVPVAATPFSESSFSQVSTTDPVEGSPTLMKHLRTELQIDDPTRRHNALLDVVALTKCPESCTISMNSASIKKLHIQNETGLGTAIDLDPLIPVLLKTYRSDPNDGYRFMALSALLNIGNDKALNQLIVDSAFQPTHVKQMTHRRIAAFYLTMYPELTESTYRSKNLQMNDVVRAKAARAKLAKAQL